MKEEDLRDWFAGQFLVGAALNNPTISVADGESIADARARYWREVSEMAYVVADSMLVARKRGKP